MYPLVALAAELPSITNAPIVTGVGNFPATIVLTSTVILTAVMIVISGKFDKSGGVLTLSILITLGMLGAITYCLIFTVPVDDITPGVVGGLTAGFGAVVAHWLGRVANGGRPPEDPPHE
jgi:hypothetical protein